jgi:DNA helicase-2/ATP-dependent DNA helicase PcrA
VFGFLEEISLVTDVDKYDENADAVVLMTIHAAKGLEFPVVFIAGMEDGIFPSQQNLGEMEEMSEERRLAYVAITRAKEKLFITHTRNRMMYGKTAYNPISRFVREIPSRYIELDRPRQAPPRVSNAAPRPARREDSERPMTEFRRKPEIAPTPQRPRGAEGYGIQKLSVGTRVNHGIFGDGVILSSRDMGGDVLYEVKFDNGQVKKLMATFAKLKKI